MNADQIFVYGVWAWIALCVLAMCVPPFRRSTRCWCGHETDDLRAHQREHVRGTR